MQHTDRVWPQDWPQDWPLRNARVPCLRKEGAKRPAVHHCPPLPAAAHLCRLGRVGVAERAMGCAFAGASDVPRGRDATIAGAHRSSPDSHPPAGPGQRAEQSRTKSSAPRPVGLIHHSKVVTTMTHAYTSPSVQRAMTTSAFGRRRGSAS